MAFINDKEVLFSVEVPGMITIDHQFDPESENPQSGKAVAQAVENVDYNLPVGGAELGGVKNGGNVTIKADGAMDAPVVTDAHVKEVVEDWWKERPETPVEVADGSITPTKTTFMSKNHDRLFGLNDVKSIKAGVKSAGTYYYHANMANKGLSLNVEGFSKIVVKAFVSYINWVQTAEEIKASGVKVISSGYTTTNPSMYGATSDVDTPEMREVEIDIAEGASYILIDFGVTKPTYVSVGTYNGTYDFNDVVNIHNKISRPQDEYGNFIDGTTGQVLYANGEHPYWGKKINPGDVSAKDTTFWGSEALNIKVECEELPRIELPWKKVYYQQTGTNGQTYYYTLAKIDEPGYAILLKAGVEYIILCANHKLEYWKNDPRTLTPTDLTDTEIANLEHNGHDVTKYKKISNPISLGLYQTHGGKITPETDIYINVSETIYGAFKVFEAEKVEYLKDLSGMSIYYRTTDKDIIYKEPFTYNTGQHLNDGRAYYNKYVINEKMRRLIRQTDYLDSLALSNFRLCFIGDSITYAASNAGLQRAFRKMVPYKLQVATTDTAISGTCMTNGYGFKWNCGVQGVDGLLTDATYIQNVPADPMKRPQIFIIALGTNDFGNNAPLGNVEAEDRDTTFAGCYLKLVETLRTNYPKAGIILMCPFNRQNGLEPNANGDILLDYCRVIHEIVSFTPHTWVLDLSNHPLVNFTGYPEAYVDPVHIGKYAHAVVSNELYRLIMEIIAVSGFDYLPCLDNLNV